MKWPAGAREIRPGPGRGFCSLSVPKPGARAGLRLLIFSMLLPGGLWRACGNANSPMGRRGLGPPPAAAVLWREGAEEKSGPRRLPRHVGVVWATKLALPLSRRPAAESPEQKADSGPNFRPARSRRRSAAGRRIGSPRRRPPGATPKLAGACFMPVGRGCSSATVAGASEDL